LWITEEAVAKLSKVANINIKGVIHIVTEAGGNILKNISFDTKKALVNVFGNIDNPDADLSILYAKSDVTGITVNKEVFIYLSEGVTEQVHSSEIFGLTINDGNSVSILNELNPDNTKNPDTLGRLNITYSMPSISGVASIDKYGNIT